MSWSGKAGVLGGMAVGLILGVAIPAWSAWTDPGTNPNFKVNPQCFGIMQGILDPLKVGQAFEAHVTGAVPGQGSISTMALKNHSGGPVTFVKKGANTATTYTNFVVLLEDVREKANLKKIALPFTTPGATHQQIMNHNSAALGEHLIEGLCAETLP